MGIWQRLLLVIGSSQMLVIGKEFMEREAKFSAAQKVARRLGKPFLVVGGPYGTNSLRQLFRFKAHGCADLCVDIDARACEGCAYQWGDIRVLPLVSIPSQYKEVE